MASGTHGEAVEADGAGIDASLTVASPLEADLSVRANYTSDNSSFVVLTHHGPIKPRPVIPRARVNKPYRSLGIGQHDQRCPVGEIRRNVYPEVRTCRAGQDQSAAVLLPSTLSQ